MSRCETIHDDIDYADDNGNEEVDNDDDADYEGNSDVEFDIDSQNDQWVQYHINTWTFIQSLHLH